MSEYLPEKGTPHMTHWTTEYYDIMEFYFWEPQHLDLVKKNGDKKNLAGVLGHIQRMEVSLNHLFNLFFRLIPSDFSNRLLASYAALEHVAPLTFTGREDYEAFSRMVQPDLLLRSNTLNFSIEMKIGAKSSLEQVWKYSLLHWQEEQHTGVSKDSALLYIGKRDFRFLWKEKFQSIEELKSAAIAFNTSDLASKATTNETVKIDWPAVKATLERTSIGYCSYQDFDQFLSNYGEGLSGSKAANETVHKLISGLRKEMVFRGLV